MLAPGPEIAGDQGAAVADVEAPVDRRHSGAQAHIPDHPRPVDGQGDMGVLAGREARTAAKRHDRRRTTAPPGDVSPGYPSRISRFPGSKTWRRPVS